MTEAPVETDVQRSLTNVRAIKQGLDGADADFWRDRARRRRDALTEDGAMFGLLRHEEAELRSLNYMLGKSA